MAGVSAQDLQGYGLFRDLPRAVIEAAAGDARPILARAGETLYREAGRPETVYLLLEGVVKLVVLTATGKSLLLGFVGPGHVFGCEAAVGAAEHFLTAVAATSARMAGWNGPAMRRLLGSYPGLAYNQVGFLSGCLRDCLERYRELACEMVEQRLARSILRLASQFGKPNREGVRIDLALTREDLAMMTCSGLHTVSRILSRWTAGGLVRTLASHRLLLTDREGLAAIAEGN